MDTVASLVPLALLVQGIVNVVKSQLPTLPDKLKWVYAALGWILGVAIAVAVPLDLLAATGHPIAVPLLGEIVTGLAIGVGSNFASDLTGFVRSGPTPGALTIPAGVTISTGASVNAYPTPPPGVVTK